jgi:Ig-like domain from next to BRCA1 gene
MTKGDASSPQISQQEKLVWRYRMRYTKSVWLIVLLVFALVLSACNFGQQPEPTPDVGAIFTAAAETVMAQFSVELTQTALAAPTATEPPTITPPPTFAVENPGAGSPAATSIVTLGIGTQPVILPTITPVAALATQGDTCYNSEFVADVTYPDGTAVKGGDLIAKVWSIKNTGTCTWDDGFSLQPITGESMGGKAWVITAKKDFVKPDEIVEIRIDMTVPDKAGDHGGCWKMQGDNGYYFGTPLCILVKVQ